MTNKVIVQKSVGEVSVRVEASSDNPDISMQDLLGIATTLVSRDGAKVTVSVSGPDAPVEPLFKQDTATLEKHIAEVEEENKNLRSKLVDAVAAAEKSDRERNSMYNNYKEVNKQIASYQDRLRLINGFVDSIKRVS